MLVVMVDLLLVDIGIDELVDVDVEIDVLVDVVEEVLEDDPDSECLDMGRLTSLLKAVSDFSASETLSSKDFCNSNV